MNAPLQSLESSGAAVRIERDDLAVEDDRLLLPARPLRQGGGDLGELRGFFVAKPRPEADRACWRDLGDRPDAVVFRFVDEMRILERRVLERRQHWLEHPQ